MEHLRAPVRAGQGQRAAGGAVDHVQHGVGGDGVLQERAHGGLERHGGVDGQDGGRPHQAVPAAREDTLAGGRGQGLPRLQRPRPHRARAAGQDLPRLPAKVHPAAQEPERAPRLRLRHPRQRPPLRAPGQDRHRLRFHHRQLFKRVILPGRSEKDSWGAQLVRVGCAPSNWRHCRKVLQEMGPSVVLPPHRHPVCGFHPGSGRHCGWSIVVQQDPSQRPGAQGPRHICACARHLADSSNLPEAQQGLQVPQILELVPPLGRPARALLCCGQHCPWDQGRRRRQLLEDRLRFQPGHPPDHHHHPGSPAVDKVEKQQQLYARTRILIKDDQLGSCVVV